MLRHLVPLAGLAAVFLPQPATADFILDLSPAETVESLGIQTIGDLSVRDRFHFSAGSLCRHDGRLMLPALIEPRTLGSYSLMMMRGEIGPDRTIEAAIVFGDRVQDRHEEVRSVLRYLGSISECETESSQWEAVTAFNVVTIDGTTSLSELTALHVAGSAAASAEPRADDPSDELAALVRRALETTPPIWSTTEGKSEMDDSPTVVIAGRSSREAFTNFGREYRLRLVLRCRENTSSIYVTSPHLFTIGDDLSVEYRLDDLPAVKETWRLSTDGKAAGKWRGGQSVPFIRSLIEAQRLVVRLHPPRSRTVMGIWDLKGLDTEVAKLRAACNW